MCIEPCRFCVRWRVEKLWQILQSPPYVLVAPALAILLQRSRWYGWLWVLTLTPLLRAVWGFHNVWVDHFYMLGLLIGMGWVMIEQQHALNN